MSQANAPGSGSQYSTEPVPRELGLLGKIKARQKAKRGLREYRSRFGEIQTFCMFLGSGRSGHSLVGSLLDAHPRAVIAHELDAFKFLNAGLSVEEMFALLILQDLAFGEHGRNWSGYDYKVPNQWQGRFEALQVIGDKKGGRTTERLREKPELLTRLRRDLKADLRIVHVIRNPFDNIATLANRRKEPLEAAFERYERKIRTIEQMQSDLERGELLDIYLEDLVAQPIETLKTLCKFVGLDAEEQYLADAASVVFASPKRTRDSVEWSSAQRRMVEDLIASHAMLRDYTFDSAAGGR